LMTFDDFLLPHSCLYAVQCMSILFNLTRIVYLYSCAHVGAILVLYNNRPLVAIFQIFEFIITL